MVTDVHAHIMTHNIEGGKRNLLTVAERFGVDRYYISSIDGNHQPDEAAIEHNNLVTHQFMKEHPELIKGYVYVNPRNANAMDVLKKGMEEQGMSGLKMWVATHADDPLNFPIFEVLLPYNHLHSFIVYTMFILLSTAFIYYKPLSQYYLS